MTLSDIIGDVRSREKTVTVRNQDVPEPMVRMLERMVDAPEVSVEHEEPSGNGPANVAVLEDENEQLAVSPIADIGDSVLMVNADLYITGTRPLYEVDTPEVLAELAGTTFTVSGKQKMLMIEISRHVESIALEADDCAIHTGFQYLSRLDDERGTRRVYERLAGNGVDVHLYGVPDEIPDLLPSATFHPEEASELLNSWFVVTQDCPDSDKAALLAQRSGPGEWTGFWTFDTDVVDRVGSYLRETY